MTPTIEPVEAPLVTVDPGQVIKVSARFTNEPKAILFSYLAPQSDTAVHDPGAHVEGTLIQREGDLYRYVIDTRHMRGGLGWWYFVSEDEDSDKRRAKVGKFIVRDVPRALLDRGHLNRTPVTTERTISITENSGFDLLGAVPVGANDDDSSRGLLVGLGCLTLGVVLILL